MRSAHFCPESAELNLELLLVLYVLNKTRAPMRFYCGRWCTMQPNSGWRTAQSPGRRSQPDDDKCVASVFEPVS